MDIMGKMKFFEVGFIGMSIVVCILLIAGVFAAKVAFSKLVKISIIIILIGYAFSAIGFIVTRGELSNYRDDFVINHIFSEEESVVVEETNYVNSNTVNYKVKSHDALMVIDVDYRMKKDFTFDYYVKEEYKKGEQ